MKYELLGYSNLNAPYNSPPNCKCDEYKAPNYISYWYFDVRHVSVGYYLDRYTRANISATFSTDMIPPGNESIDQVGVNRYKISHVGWITHRYVGISPSYTVSTENTRRERFYTNLEVGLNFDFIYYEEYQESHKYIDSIGAPVVPYYYPYQYYPVESVPVDPNPRNGCISFNRITPFVSLYFEWFGRKKKFSFIAGSSVTFRPILSMSNTYEKIKSTKTVPVFIGLSYHFNRAPRHKSAQ